MTVRPAARLLALTALCAGSGALGETRLSADVFGGLGYSRNPFFFAGDGSGGGTATYDIGIRPRIDILNPRSGLSVIGRATLQDYFRDLPNSNAYGVTAAWNFRVNERLNWNANLAYDNSIIGANGGFFEPGPIIGPVIPVVPGVEDPTVSPPIVLPPLPIPGVGTDLGFIGARNRQQTYQASAGFGYVMSARDSVNASGFASASRFNRTTNLGNFGDYESFGGSIGYQRRLSERISVGLQGSLSHNDYGSLRGSSDVRTIQATAQARLSALWSVNGALGVTFSSGSEFEGTSRALSGNLQACRAGERGQLCLTGSRSVQPTGFAGTQKQTSLAASYSYRLDERTTLRADASYVESSGAGQVANLFANEFGRANIGADRRLTSRLFLDGSLFYRRTIGRNVNFPDDYGGRVGVRYRFGDPR